MTLPKASRFRFAAAFAGLLTANVVHAQPAPSPPPPGPPPAPPADVPRAPSPAPKVPPASGPEVTVVARDGATFHGQMVEKIPGQYVTLRLATGEQRRIAWWFIQSLIGPDGTDQITGPQVAIDFRADDDRAKLQKLGKDGEWFDACQSPCRGRVSATGIYRVGGDGIRRSESFKLTHDGTRIDASVGTTGRTVGGAILGIGGGAVAYVGLIMLLVGASTEPQTSSGGPSRPLTNDERSDLMTVGSLMLLGGAGAGVGGLLILLNNQTDVTFSQGRAARPAAPGASAGRAISLGRGFYLTERGLAF